MYGFKVGGNLNIFRLPQLWASAFQIGFFEPVFALPTYFFDVETSIIHCHAAPILAKTLSGSTFAPRPFAACPPLAANSAIIAIS